MSTIINQVETQITNFGLVANTTVITRYNFTEVNIQVGVKNEQAVFNTVNNLAVISLSHEPNRDKVTSCIQFSRFLAVYDSVKARHMINILGLSEHFEKESFITEFKTFASGEVEKLNSHKIKAAAKLINQGYVKLNSDTAEQIIAKMVEKAAEAQQQNGGKEVKVTRGFTTIGSDGKKNGFTIECVKKKATRFYIDFSIQSKEETQDKLNEAFMKIDGDFKVRK
jgi:hypothetical protein